MSKTTKTTYNSADGLSQDEFEELVRIKSIPMDERVENEMIDLILYLERIVAAKERQIADLYEELYNKSIENHK